MEVDAQQLRDKALEVITKVVQDDKLHEFTYGTYRKKVEETLSLEPGTLDAPEHKAVVHAIAKDYISRLDEDSQEQPEEETAAKKGKPRGSASKAAQPRKGRTKGEAGTPVKKAAAKGKKAAARSASVVPTSSDEAASGTGGAPSRPNSRATATAKAKRAGRELEDSVDEPPAKRAREEYTPTEKTVSAPAVPSPSRPRANAAVEEQKSDSELSVLIDEPPSRKRNKKGANEDLQKSKATKGRKKKEPAKELSKDEETIKRLKSFVVACGVRKVWAKEFKDLEKPSEQIRRLKQILADLGMNGRMSMEQAKAIKAKREFEQELQDVKEFASKVSSAPSAKGRRQKETTVDEGEEDAESEVEVIPKRKTARQSIMAFLGDESD
ncbi:hypothetical protein C2E23DRAFT_827932 [Lenzites betulinus]|nr:hypothetical protein C2E23DRAFT_827932 [Lenzites betulinus]